VGLECFPVQNQPITLQRGQHSADGVLLLPPHRHGPFCCCHVLALLRYGQIGEGFLVIQPGDPLRRCRKVHAQGAFNDHLEETELPRNL